MANEIVRNERKTRIGEVVSNKMDKTIVVLIKTKVLHPVYGKTLNHSTKVKADDPENICDIGDTVEIAEYMGIMVTTMGTKRLERMNARNSPLPG